MLDYTYCLAVVDDTAHLDDKLLRIHLKLHKLVFPYALQNIYYRASCKSCALHKFSHEVVFHSARHSFLHVHRFSCSLLHSLSGFKRLLVLNLVHAAAFHHYSYFSHVKVLVDFFH